MPYHQQFEMIRIQPIKHYASNFSSSRHVVHGEKGYAQSIGTYNMVILSLSVIDTMSYSGFPCLVLAQQF